MTVYYETLKAKGAQIKGEVKSVNNVIKIIEEDDIVRLWHCENWETLLSKDMYRIVHIVYQC